MGSSCGESHSSEPQAPFSELISYTAFAISVQAAPGDVRAEPAGALDDAVLLGPSGLTKQEVLLYAPPQVCLAVVY